MAAREADAFLFGCLDHYGTTGLLFSPDGPERSIQDAIGNAFWAILLREPNDLADFQARVFHSGAGIWLNYTCKDGELSFDERDDLRDPQ